MNNYFRVLITLILFLSLSGCDRLSPTPAMEMSVVTPHEEIAQPIEPSISLDDLDAATQNTLNVYPLWVGSSWVYEYLGYHQDVEIVWRVVETVVSSQIIDGYYIAKVERTAERIDGDIPQGFLAEPYIGIFWYLIDGENIYLYEFELDPDLDLSAAWLELVFPFPKDGEAWYPDPNERAFLQTRLTGFRYASDPFKKELPMGGTYTCYNIATRYKDSTEEKTFCENVGIVYNEFVLNDRSWGFFVELIGFSIQ